MFLEFSVETNLVRRTPTSISRGCLFAKWTDKIEAARSAAEDQRFKIGHAVVLWCFWPKLADGVGFEPTVSVNPRRFSRPVP